MRKWENNYIKKVENKYYINPMAKIYYEALIDFKNSVDIINDFIKLYLINF